MVPPVKAGDRALEEPLRQPRGVTGGAAGHGRPCVCMNVYVGVDVCENYISEENNIPVS